MDKGKLILIPSSLGESMAWQFTPRDQQLIFELEFFVVENEKSARRFLRIIGFAKSFDEVQMVRAEHDADFIAEENFVVHLLAGKNVGLISEAGCPGIADPGAAVVKWAHANDVNVMPLAGASSVFLALMASGLNGQHFCFNGYLPVDSALRKKKLQQLEEESARKSLTQIFMETPYRNDALLKDALQILRSETQLCIAANITQPQQLIKTFSVSAWKKNIPQLKNQPAIFLLLA